MKQEYETKDFYFSAFLLAMGCDLIKQTRKNSITTFTFTMDSNTIELMEDYYSLRAMIEPMAFGNAIRQLKSIIYSSANSNTGTNSNANTNKG